VIKKYLTSLCLLESGIVYTWGLNGPSCRLGLGNNEHAFTPKQISLDKEIIDLSLGTNHILATCIE
jgi:alpha-tubulin suppressor-like RCC1 family protein